MAVSSLGWKWGIGRADRGDNDRRCPDFPEVARLCVWGRVPVSVKSTIFDIPAAPREQDDAVLLPTLAHTASGAGN